MSAPPPAPTVPLCFICHASLLDAVPSFASSSSSSSVLGVVVGGGGGGGGVGRPNRAASAAGGGGGGVSLISSQGVVVGGVGPGEIRCGICRSFTLCSPGPSSSSSGKPSTTLLESVLKSVQSSMTPYLPPVSPSFPHPSPSSSSSCLCRLRLPSRDVVRSPDKVQVVLDGVVVLRALGVLDFCFGYASSSGSGSGGKEKKSKAVVEKAGEVYKGVRRRLEGEVYSRVGVWLRERMLRGCLWCGGGGGGGTSHGPMPPPEEEEEEEEVEEEEVWGGGDDDGTLAIVAVVGT